MGETLSNTEKIFIFGFLRENHVKMEVRYNNLSTQAIIVDFNRKEIMVEVDDVFEGFQDYKPKIEVFFFFQNNHHAFKTRILKLKGKKAIFENPERIAKNLQRKYERIKMPQEKDYKISFWLEGQLNPLDYPISQRYYYTEKPPIKADFSMINIHEILRRFKNKLSYFTSSNSITMLRNKKVNGFLDEMVVKYGKVLYIPNTYADLDIKNDKDHLNIIKKEDWVNFEIKRNNTLDTYVNKAIFDYLIELKESGVYSMIIVPVLYRNYVVALIKVYNDYKKSTVINLDIINYVQQFAEILSFALKSNGYFDAEVGEKEVFTLPINDLSPGGFSVVTESAKLVNKLSMHINVNIDVEIEERKINCQSKLVRLTENMLQKHYGFMFLDIKSDDLLYLSEFLKKIT